MFETRVQNDRTGRIPGEETKSPSKRPLGSFDRKLIQRGRTEKAARIK